MEQSLKRFVAVHSAFQNTTSIHAENCPRAQKRNGMVRQLVQASNLGDVEAQLRSEPSFDRTVEVCACARNAAKGGSK